MTSLVPISYDVDKLKCFTRHEAYRCKVPKIKNPENCCLQKYPSKQQVATPCNYKYLARRNTARRNTANLENRIAKGREISS